MEFDASDVFKNKSVLSHHWVPPVIRGRNREKKELKMGLLDAGEIPVNFYLTGRPGTGKTILVKNIVQNNILASLNKRGLNAEFIHIYCSQFTKTFHVLREICTHLNSENHPRIENTTNSYWKFLTKKSKEYDSIILFLDESDHFKSNEDLLLIKKISDLMDTGSTDCIFSTICSTNDMTWLDNLSNATLSRFNPKELFFKTYNAKVLNEILKDRVKYGLKKEYIDQGLLSYLAAYGAKNHGDARQSIDALKNAVDYAFQRKLPKVSDDIIRGTDIFNERKKFILKIACYPKNHLAVLAAYLNTIEVLRKKRKSACKSKQRYPRTNDIYEEYLKIAQSKYVTGVDEVTPRMMRKWLKLLNEDNIIISDQRGLGQGRGKAAFHRLNIERDVIYDGIVESKVFMNPDSIISFERTHGNNLMKSNQSSFNSEIDNYC